VLVWEQRRLRRGRSVPSAARGRRALPSGTAAASAASKRKDDEQHVLARSSTSTPRASLAVHALVPSIPTRTVRTRPRPPLLPLPPPCTEASPLILGPQARDATLDPAERSNPPGCRSAGLRGRATRLINGEEPLVVLIAPAVPYWAILAAVRGCKAHTSMSFSTIAPGGRVWVHAWRSYCGSS